MVKIVNHTERDIWKHRFPLPEKVIDTPRLKEDEMIEKRQNALLQEESM